MQINNELLIRIAELYYRQRLSQKEIADMLDLSRPTVSRLLDEARKSGIVEIKINTLVNTPLAIDHQLSAQLRERFKLVDAIVIAGEYEFETALRHCARAAAAFLTTILDNNQSIGISWGRPIDLLCEYLRPGHYYNLNIYQLTGCLSNLIPNPNSLEFIINIARRLEAHYATIYAPLYLENQLIQTELLRDASIKKVLQHADKLDILITGIGGLCDKNAAIQQAGFITNKDRLELMANGAVGHMLSRMYDIDGNEVSCPNKYPIAAELRVMRHATWSIGITASAVRSRAVLGALNGHYLNVLITDKLLALELLNQADITHSFL